MVGGNNTFAKTICSICYEDLKPIVEDLQSISLCGHVFHELCLQQWFEYCTNGKKKNCPVCKQTCTEKNTNRLYFQSVGDPNDTSFSQKPHDIEESSCELRNEVKRLEGKVLKLASALEEQQKYVKEVNAELVTCKEQLKVEVTLKNEAKKQKTAIQQLLHLKSQELDKSTLECGRLQERSMALAKELAALKLVSDVDLGEEQVLKLASLGNGANSKETIDVLKKSLVIRNKSYKELMVKCNALGRGEARSLSKLEKAIEKIDKFKARVQELEMALEGRDNENLRTLRASKNFNVEARKGFIEEPKVDKLSYENWKKALDETEENLHQVTDIGHDSSPKKKRKLMHNGASEKNTADYITAGCLGRDKLEKNSFQKNKDGLILETSSYVHDLSKHKLNPPIDHKKAVHDSVLSRLEVTSSTAGGAQVQVSDNKDGLSGPRSCGKKNTINTTPVTILDDNDLLPPDDFIKHQPSFQIKKGTSSPTLLAEPGDNCFSGGLLGPDGTSWHLGKWCKKVQSKGSTGLQGSGANSGDLISVGADGRGGRIKVLRSINQASLDNKENTASVKRCKYGTKASSIQSQGQGCLQIEHFFKRAGQ